MNFKIFVYLIIVLLSFFAEAKCKAILVNGGMTPNANYGIHGTQLKEMYQSLLNQGCKEEDIFVFSATGKTNGKDFRSDPIDPNPKFNSFSYKFNDKNKVENLFPADNGTLKAKIAELSSTFSPNDKVFVYLNDHGNSVNGKKGLVPWTSDFSEVFTTEDLEEAIGKAPKTTSFKVWADCCFCGTFTKLSRTNSCVATATDEFHLGNYFWSNWNKYVEKGAYTGPVIPSVKATFAGQIRSKNKDNSLELAARIARLPNSDGVFIEAGTISKGCFIGPRDTSEQYIFETIGFGDKQICQEDILRILNKDLQKNKLFARDCDVNEGFKEIKDLKQILESLEKSHAQMKTYEKTRIRKLISNINSSISNIQNSKEFKIIQEINEEFTLLSEDKKVEQSFQLQQQVAALKSKILKDSNVFNLILNDQKVVMEAIFFTKATDLEKKEYQRKRVCLDEPLF